MPVPRRARAALGTAIAVYPVNRPGNGRIAEELDRQLVAVVEGLSPSAKEITPPPSPGGQQHGADRASPVAAG